MTTIVGLRRGSTITIGADSQVTDNDRANNHTKMEKISRRNGYIIGGAGDSLPCDILQHIWNPPIPTAKDKKDIYHFVITKVVPSMRQVLEENEWKPNPNDSDAGFSMLIALEGQIFDIGDDFGVVLRDDGIYGVGNGAKYAIGALYAGATVQRALEIAAKNDLYTSGPFQVVKQTKRNTKSKTTKGTTEPKKKTIKKKTVTKQNS